MEGNESRKRRQVLNETGLMQEGPSPSMISQGTKRALITSEFLAEQREKSEESFGFEALYNEAQSRRQSEAGDMDPVPAADDAVTNTQDEGKASRVSRSRISRKRAVVPAQEPRKTVRAKVTIPGFGVVPTEFSALDIGEGCVHLELSAYSWSPQQASTDGDGNLQGGFQLDAVPGRTLYHIGLEWTDGSGARHLVLCSPPGASGTDK